MHRFTISKDPESKKWIVDTPTHSVYTCDTREQARQWVRDQNSPTNIDEIKSAIIAIASEAKPAKRYFQDRTRPNGWIDMVFVGTPAEQWFEDNKRFKEVSQVDYEAYRTTVRNARKDRRKNKTQRFTMRGGKRIKLK